ncbi:MAG: endonuclease/exonuclease/phosphatase family protein [Bacteroidota bacterium]
MNRIFVKIDMRKAVFILAGFLLFSCAENKKVSDKNLTVVFYNVENLFDVVGDPSKPDGEFTPEGAKKWNQERYNKKIEDISKVLSSINPEDLPEIIGLCEIENRTVLNDLVKTSVLKPGNYKIVHYESPDFRGIDNTMLYRPDEFKVISSQPIRINFEDDPEYTTRDILYIKGKTTNNEIFHIFINHWPSRTSGEKESEPKRIFVASVLKAKVDSLIAAEENPNIIILGDMNDEPANISLLNTLGARDPAVEPTAVLQNLMFDVDNKNLGSYNFRGNWNMLDNIVVSKSLLDNKGFCCIEKQGFVFQQEWMEFKNNNGQITPNRTYGGPNYYGGISDHFPVYFLLKR